VAPGTVTTVGPVMDIATAAEPVMDIAMAADQGVCGGGDKRAPRAFRIRLVARAF
jgi:enoyl reductase-like protein